MCNNIVVLLLLLVIALLQVESFTKSFFGAKAAVTAPPKVDKKSKTGTKINPPNPDIIFRENRDIIRELEEYFDSEKYNVILYNDPFNKRQYVETVLMEVFGWSKELANSVMLQAHNFGFAITGEYVKDIADSYAKTLLEKGLIAESKKADKD